VGDHQVPVHRDVPGGETEVGRGGMEGQEAADQRVTVRFGVGRGVPVDEVGGDQRRDRGRVTFGDGGVRGVVEGVDQPAVGFLPCGVGLGRKVGRADGHGRGE